MGELFKDGESRPITQDDWALYPKARVLQALHRVPVLQHADNPHEYLFFALFDGTGQDVDNLDQLPTNIGVLKEQVYELSMAPDLRIGGHYAEGIGTQANPISRGYDGLFAFTWDEKIEEAYRALAQQTWEWQQQDPQAQVRIAEVGYSRGAVLAAGFARLVDQYGIAHPSDLTFGRDPYGNITVESPRPPLVQPGQTAQALGLFDPVATNLPENFDARPPPSVIGALAIAAADERRTAFPHQTILEPGLSPDRHFVNLLLPGGHSNIGGGNSQPGLEAMAFNHMADYLNGLRDRPLIEYRALPDDPALYTVYQARGPTAVPGLDDDGLRDLRQELANCTIVDPCRDAEPMDQALADRFEYRPLQPRAPMPAFLQPQREIAMRAQQQAGQSQAEREGREALEHKAEQSPAARGDNPDLSGLQPFSHPDHPQHALYADVRQRFAAKGVDLSEEQLSVLTGRMHASGYAPGWQGDVTAYEGRAVVGSFQPGKRMASVQMTTPAPSVQDTMQDFRDEQQNRAQAMDRLHQQQATAREHGHGLSR